MSMSYRLGIVLLSAAVVFGMSNSPAAFGQRFRSGGNSNQGNSNQGNKDKKDKDSDDDDHKDKKDKKDQGGQSGNQGGQNSNQGSNQNNNSGNSNNNQNNSSGNSNKSGGSNKSGNSGVPPQLQPFIQGQGGKNQKDKDKDKNSNQDQNNQGQNGNQGSNFPGQGGQNKLGGGNKTGLSGQQLQQAQQNQKFKDFKSDNDDDRDHKKMNFGSWRGDKWEGSNKAENWARAFGYKKTSLFGDKWYQDHPQAWKYNNNKANIWVAATVPGVYSWLNWGNVPPEYGVNYRTPIERFDPSRYGEWYPLGVYSLMSNSDDMGTRIVQLAVDRRGNLAGTYFDMITDTEHSIVGQIGQQSQRAEWSLRKNPDVRFSASINRLLQPYGYVTVQLPGGDQRWQFVRLEN